MYNKKKYHNNKAKAQVLEIIAFIIIVLVLILNFQVKFIIIIPYNLRKRIMIINKSENKYKKRFFT
jgi:hypothetical protein